jgi:hypothetical protein
MYRNKRHTTGETSNRIGYSVLPTCSFAALEYFSASMRECSGRERAKGPAATEGGNRVLIKHHSQIVLTRMNPKSRKMFRALPSKCFG